MSATGLQVFDKTLQTTNIWLDEIMETVGPDRQVAWHTMVAVLRTLRDRLPIDVGAHLSAQLPMLIRGAYYEQWQPRAEPEKIRDVDEFLARINEGVADIRPVNVREATRQVFRVISRHIDRGQAEKVRDSLPADILSLWPEEFLAEAPTQGRGVAG